MRHHRSAAAGTAALAGGVLVALAACGAPATKPPAALPRSGKAYRALSIGGRTAVAASCRDRAAARLHGTAARQVRAVDPRALRTELDDAFTVIAAQRRAVASVCAQRLPFVTPGLRVGFAGADRDGAGAFTYETTSDKLLTIRGQVTPAPRGGRVVARREVGAPRPRRTTIAADGRFAIPRLHLRKIADNTFALRIDAPPNAPRAVRFSAICLDCLAGAPPSAPQ
jgi:hypothetical protein